MKYSCSLSPYVALPILHPLAVFLLLCCELCPKYHQSTKMDFRNMSINAVYNLKPYSVSKHVSMKMVQYSQNHPSSPHQIPTDVVSSKTIPPICVIFDISCIFIFTYENFMSTQLENISIFFTWKWGSYFWASIIWVWTTGENILNLLLSLLVAPVYCPLMSDHGRCFKPSGIFLINANRFSQ